MEQKWITQAKKYINEREIKGDKHNPLILKWWKDIKRSGIKNDETPWCAAYVGGVLEEVGIKSSRFESAKSYLDWGVKLNSAKTGCIVVFSRTGGGHVGFVVGQDKGGNLLVLGGNQNDAVNIKSFSKANVVGYRWPEGFDIDETALSVGTAETAGSVT